MAFSNWVTKMDFCYSAINPILYNAMSYKFRRAFQRVLCCRHTQKPYASSKTYSIKRRRSLSMTTSLRRTTDWRPTQKEPQSENRVWLGFNWNAGFSGTVWFDSKSIHLFLVRTFVLYTFKAVEYFWIKCDKRNNHTQKNKFFYFAVTYFWVWLIVFQFLMDFYAVQ